MSHLTFRYDDRADKANQPITSWIHRFDNAAIEALLNHYRPLLKTIAGRNWDQRFRHGMEYREIGEKLGRSEDEVRHLVTHCIKLIRKDLSRKYFDDLNDRVGAQ